MTLLAIAALLFVVGSWIGRQLRAIAAHYREVGDDRCGDQVRRPVGEWSPGIWRST